MKNGKTWAEKMNTPAAPQVKRLDKAFSDMAEGFMMLIPTPQIIANYLKETAPGCPVTIAQMRKDLAADFNAEATCPLTTGIFLRIVAEYTGSQFAEGMPVSSLVPIWRILQPGMPVWKKLQFDTNWILRQRKAEGLMG